MQFDQEQLAVRLGDIQLMADGQPLPFDAKAASTYLKETCAVHGTVNIAVSIGSGPGTGVCVCVGGVSYSNWVHVCKPTQATASLLPPPIWNMAVTCA